MPAADRVEPTLLDAVCARLTRSGTAAMDASHELLAHYADTGDAPTQHAVDTLVDRAAGSLQALAGSLAEAAHELDALSARATRDGGKPAVPPSRTGPRAARRRGSCG